MFRGNISRQITSRAIGERGNPVQHCAAPARHGGTMQLMFLFTITPIVQKIVMQQGAANQTFHIDPQPQPLCHTNTHQRNRDRMVVTTDKAMLAKILFLLHTLRRENITGMLLEKISQADTGTFAIQVCHPSFSESGKISVHAQTGVNPTGKPEGLTPVTLVSHRRLELRTL